MIRKNFFLGLILVPFLLSSNQEDIYYQQVFSSDQGKQGIHDFFTNIFNALPSDAYYNLLEGIMEYNPQANDEKIYSILVKSVLQIKPGFFDSMSRTLASLKVQKEEMVRQVVEMLPEQKKIDGYLEIGSPGRYVSTLKKHFELTNTIYCMNDSKKWTDAIERGTVTAPGKFITLTYDPILEEDIPSNSLDLVTCFIGLHHCPIKKLPAFIQSVRRVLKPGGMFIVRDHDATEDVYALVHLAHSTYNAGLGILLKDEIDEVRNFQPLNYWINGVEQEGFKVLPARLLQKGDPTVNTLFAFAKILTESEQTVFDAEQDVAKDSTYKRDMSQSYATLPEWYTVDIVKEYGAFLHHTPWFQYPYFQTVKQFWTLVYKSSEVARKKSGFVNAYLSPYALMNGVIGSVITGVFAQLSILAVIPRMIYGTPGEVEADTIKMLVWDNKGVIASLGSDVKILKEYDNSLKLIEVSRYIPFTDLLKKVGQLHSDDIAIENIAGQSCIQVRVQVSAQTDDRLFNVTGCKKLYEYPMVTNLEIKDIALDVEIKHLPAVLKHLFDNNVSVEHIFDY